MVVIKEVFIKIFIFFMLKSYANNNDAKSLESSSESLEFPSESLESPFETIISEPTFIDKTDLIKSIMKNRKSFKNRIILTMPRQFGKTTNVDMMKRFFERSHYKERKISNTLLFQNRPYDSSLNIMNDKDFVNKHFGKHPVIHIELSLKVATRTLDGLFSELTRKYAKAIMEFNWLYEEKYQNAIELNFQDRRMKFCFEFFSLSDEDENVDINHSCYHTWLFHLGKSLYKYYGVPPILLVDEYDCPISQALYSKLETSLIVDKLSTLWFTALKDSDAPFLFTYMVGITGIYTNIGISTLQFQKMPFLIDNIFAKYFGFYEDELKVLFERYGITNEDVKAQITRFYNGYRNENGVKFYNPCSLSDFLNKILLFKVDPNNIVEVVRKLRYRYPEPYLINEIKSSLDNPSIYHKFVNLTRHNRSITFKNMDDLSIQDLKHLSVVTKKTVLREEKESMSLENVYFSFLLQTGFLSYDEKLTHYKVPNEHIKYHLEEALKNHFIGIHFHFFELAKVVVDNFITIVDHLKISEEDVKKVKNSLESLFKHDVLRKKMKNPGINFKEHNFQDSLSSALQDSGNFYYVHTEEDMLKKEDDEGNERKGEADIAIVSKDCLTALIVELKYNVQPSAFENAIEQQLKRYTPTAGFLHMIQGLDVNLKYMLIDVKVKPKKGIINNNKSEIEETCDIDIAYCPAGSYSKKDIASSSRVIKFDENCIILREKEPRKKRI